MQALRRIREVLELIVCPVCYGRLSLLEQEQPVAQKEASAVVCGGCGRRYPVEDGIPVLLESRASR
jgi:uncharacterized protein YbaR (Trm112 family)